MNTPRVLLTTALLTAALGSSAQAANLCQKPHTTTLAKNSYARVYAKGTAAKVCVKSTGVRYTLPGASPTDDVFTLGGQFVGFSTADGYVRVLHIADKKIPRFMPNGTGAHVDAIVVKPSGAAAWAITRTDDTHAIQGQDFEDMAPDEFSAAGIDLVDLPGAAVGWTDIHGTAQTTNLFTEPAEIF